MSSNINLSPKDAQFLGLKGSVLANQTIGFIDQEKKAGQSLDDAYLDLENFGTLRKARPSTVIRKKVEEYDSNSADFQAFKSWKTPIESEHHFAKYKLTTPLIGQLENINFSEDNYPYSDNNFFNKFNNVYPKYQINANEYVRLRYPQESQNTQFISLQRESGISRFSPSNPALNSKNEKRKNYYQWHQNQTRFEVNNEKAYLSNLNFSGFNVPYPNTLSLFESRAYNYPVKIAPQFNQENNLRVNGLIVISTGTASNKKICYVSPHGLSSGIANTIEDIYTERYAKNYNKNPFKTEHATLSGSAWFDRNGPTGVIDSLTNATGYLFNLNADYRINKLNTKGGYLRFTHSRYKNYQIYFEPSVMNQYGSGSWLICISGVQNFAPNKNKGVLYKYEPSSLEDSLKKDPRALSSSNWKIASGVPFAASGEFSRAGNPSTIKISHHTDFTIKKSIKSYRLETPVLLLNSLYSNDGYVLPKGINNITYLKSQKKGLAYATQQNPLYATEDVTIYDPELDINVIYESGSVTGYTTTLVGGYDTDDGQFITFAQEQASGINIPREEIITTKFAIDNNEHLRQTEPLKQTLFYRFYNDLYKGHKTIATGTWNGIIPSGVHFSVELISTSLNSSNASEKIGIQNGGNNLSVIYSGYGTEDAIDTDLKEVVSPYGAHEIYPKAEEVFWNQKRYPYYHNIDNLGNLVYTAYGSNESIDKAKMVAKHKANKAINKRIVGLVNKAFPNLTKKNRKWRKLQAFKENIMQRGLDPYNEEISRLLSPETKQSKAVKKQIRN